VEPATPDAVARLLLLVRGYGLGARLFAPTGPGAAFTETLQELRHILDRLARVRGSSSDPNLDPEPPTAGAMPDAGNRASVEEERTRLFVKGEVPPYEGSYESAPVTSRAPLGRGVQQLADAAGFYRAFGFQVSGDRADHLAAQLEFAALLCAKEAFAHITHEDEGAEICRLARTTFLNEHLLPWLPAFCDRVGAHTRHPIFATWALAVLRLAEEDRSWLADMATGTTATRTQ
jgi:TorA maturation chaperone TorD